MANIISIDSEEVKPEEDPFEYNGKSEYEFLRPIVTGWLGAINESKSARKGFDAVAHQCQMFYSGSLDFMWGSEFAGKYLGGTLNPRFKVTLQKAFELVAIFGPVLYWKNPQRTFKPRPDLQISPDMFGDQQDPQVQQAFQQASMMQQQRSSESNIRNQLMSLVLNYTPDEQPGGGLAAHAEAAITEGLVKGRGVLWPGPYRFPGSDRTLTGCFWDSQDNLFIDPDARNLDDAWWIARRRSQPTWKVERKFRLPQGSLKNKGSRESRTNYGISSGDDFSSLHRAQGKSNDVIVYWEIYSKMGIGSRLPGVNTTMRDAFDRVVGDYAYIAVAADVPYPLNAPSRAVRNARDEEVEKMFRWQVPYWKDDKWPCAVLDFYGNPNSAYPIPPMAPGLGELTYMNVFMSHLANRVWSNSRDFVVMLEQVSEYASEALAGGEDMVQIKIPPGIVKNINEAIAFIEQPQVNNEVWHMLDRMAKNFELRTGLSELLYGLNPGGVQSRTATDIEAKREATTVRPDYMAGKVESWMTECADMEKYAARWFIEGKDIQELVGPVGSFLWDRHIVTTDPEVVVREMRAMVEAGSARKPNKSRDAQNMQAVLPVLFPEFSKHADVTTDTNPLNSLINQWGKSIDQPTDGLMMSPRGPSPPPPEVQQQQQQAMQLEQAKIQAELQKTTAEAKAKEIDSQVKAQSMQLEQAKLQAEVQKMAAEAKAKDIDSQVKAMELQGTAPEMVEKQAEIAFDKARSDQKLAIDQASASQKMTQEESDHTQKLRQKEEEHTLKLLHLKETANLKTQSTEFESQLKSQAASEMADINADRAQEEYMIKSEQKALDRNKPAKGDKDAS